MVDTVCMFCALFHEWMCPYTCIYVGQSRDFFVKDNCWNFIFLLGLQKTEYFPLISDSLLIFIPLTYSKFLSVGDLVN